MASYFTLTLDTLAPAGVGISIADGVPTISTQTTHVDVSCSDSDKTGYQMKIYGDVDGAYDADIQSTEGASNWIAYAASKNIKLSTGDGTKTIRIKVRDDVWNTSSEQTDTITLDTSIPVVTISSGPDVTKVSKQTGKRTVHFGFTSDTDFEEYMVKVVPTNGSDHTAGTTILTTNGSSNVSGSAGGYPAATPISSTIDAADLEVASSGDGDKIVKVFVRDAASNWSV